MRYYKVCLRICGEGLDAADITSVLGVKPTKIVRVGDKGALGLARIPVWLWQAQTASGSDKWSDLEAGLQRVIDAFSNKRERLDELKQRWEVLLFCGYFSDELGGPTLSPSILRNLGDLGVELFLDTYLYESANEAADSRSSEALTES